MKPPEDGYCDSHLLAVLISAMTESSNGVPSHLE